MLSHVTFVHSGVHKKLYIKTSESYRSSGQQTDKKNTYSTKRNKTTKVIIIRTEWKGGTGNQTLTARRQEPEQGQTVLDAKVPSRKATVKSLTTTWNEPAGFNYNPHWELLVSSQWVLGKKVHMQVMQSLCKQVTTYRGAVTEKHPSLHGAGTETSPC